jgi:hypothetical protein
MLVYFVQLRIIGTQLTLTKYDFEANVNPSKPHPRWSQATEKFIGSSSDLSWELSKLCPTMATVNMWLVYIVKFYNYPHFIKLKEVFMDNKTLYEQDFYLWIRTTINQLQARQFERVDLENLLEELASMGRSEKRTIKSLLTRLLEHLLKLKYWQAEREKRRSLEGRD